jgi:hypothetical protein
MFIFKKTAPKFAQSGHSALPNGTNLSDIDEGVKEFS